MDGSFLTENMTDGSFFLPDAYFKALGTRPALPDYDYSERYDPVIGMHDDTLMPSLIFNFTSTNQ